MLDVKYEMKAGGNVVYEPQRAPESKGFGPCEVHPQKLPVERDGVVRLEHNGHWLVLFPPGMPMKNWAFKDTRDGRPYDARKAAEWLAVSFNKGKPTRVVDEAGEESTSAWTIQDLTLAAAERGMRLADIGL